MYGRQPTERCNETDEMNIKIGDKIIKAVVKYGSKYHPSPEYCRKVRHSHVTIKYWEVK